MKGGLAVKTKEQQKLLTLQQASDEFGPPYHVLRDLVNRGHMPSIRLGDSKRIWVRRCDVETMIERGAVQTELTTR
jgi:hypothetical protein